MSWYSIDISSYMNRNWLSKAVTVPIDPRTFGMTSVSLPVYVFLSKSLSFLSVFPTDRQQITMISLE